METLVAGDRRIRSYEHPQAPPMAALGSMGLKRRMLVSLVSMILLDSSGIHVSCSENCVVRDSPGLPDPSFQYYS